MATIKTFITSIVLTILIISCSDDTNNNSSRENEITPLKTKYTPMNGDASSDNTSSSPAANKTSKTTGPSTGNEKFEPFNKIDDIRAKLSDVGIGQLGAWKDDDMGGYMSITTYYRFGDVSALNGMENNLAFYLESDNPNSIKTLKLVLNINNSSQKKQALTTFSKIANKTFKQLAADIPHGLLAAIEAPKGFSADNEMFSTELKLEKSKIDTWKLTISTK